MTMTRTPAPFERGKTKRWRVERAGAPGGLGYGRGWLAMCIDTGTGAWFRSWRAAVDFVIEATTPKAD